MSIYILGDVQGCYETLQRLLDHIRFDATTDQLWSCGDLVNRGGQSLEVLRLMHSLDSSFLATLGNHDLHLLAFDERYPQGGSDNREFEAILQAPDREKLMAWLTQQPLAHWSEDHNLLMLHAGVIPQWTLQQTLGFATEIEDVLRSPLRQKFLQKMYRCGPRKWKPERGGMKQLRYISHVLTRLRFCNENGKLLPGASGPPGSQGRTFKPWFEHSNRQTQNIRIAFGHWAALGIHINRQIVALDSGCVWGGQLSAYRLEDERLFQVERHEH
jgi:bis(5'-nucleosyl)-tetraphosphatase (symmetrical)